MKSFILLIVMLVGFTSSSGWCIADLRPEKVHTADAKKNNFYIQDGLIVGGDQAMDEVVVKDIRRAPNSGFERIVIDLEGNRKGEATPITRPPFYQVAVTPDEKRVVVTLFGRPKLAFDPKKIIAGFKKSSVVEFIELLPRVEEDRWTFVMELKPGYPIEVFELTQPARIIMDVRTTQKKI